MTLRIVLFLAQVSRFFVTSFAETNWVTGGTTASCGSIWSFVPTPDYGSCVNTENNCLNGCTSLPVGSHRVSCNNECSTEAGKCCDGACVQPAFYQDHYAVLWTYPQPAGWSSSAWVGGSLSAAQNFWSASDTNVTSSGGRIIDLSGMKFSDGSVRYDSVYTWQSGPARTEFVGLTPSTLFTTTNAQELKGYKCVKLRAYRCTTADPICYTAIFEKRDTFPYVYTALSDANVSQAWTTMTTDGWRLIDVSGVQQASGAVLYTQIWDMIPGGWYYWVGNAAFFQQKLTDMKNQGFYLNHVHVYTVNGQVTYMGLFEPVPSTANFQWSFIGGLNNAEFGKYWSCMSSVPFQLAEVASYFDLEFHISH